MSDQCWHYRTKLEPCKKYEQLQRELKEMKETTMAAIEDHNIFAARVLVLRKAIDAALKLDGTGYLVQIPDPIRNILRAAIQ